MSRGKTPKIYRLPIRGYFPDGPAKGVDMARVLHLSMDHDGTLTASQKRKSPRFAPNISTKYLARPRFREFRLLPLSGTDRYSITTQPSIDSIGPSSSLRWFNEISTKLAENDGTKDPGKTDTQAVAHELSFGLYNTDAHIGELITKVHQWTKTIEIPWNISLFVDKLTSIFTIRQVGVLTRQLDGDAIEGLIFLNRLELFGKGSLAQEIQSFEHEFPTNRQVRGEIPQINISIASLKRAFTATYNELFGGLPPVERLERLEEQLLELTMPLLEALRRIHLAHPFGPISNMLGLEDPMKQ